MGNHSSANEFPADVDAYIDEECRYGAILGPFDVNPIVNVHNSPFTTRNKPNSGVGSLLTLAGSWVPQ